MNPELLAAYLRTEYRVNDRGFEFILHVNEPSSALHACHASFSVDCSAFLTAWNPRSQPLLFHENEAAMRRLVQRLESSQLQWLRGEGVDPGGDWAGEPSLLVLGLDRTSATALGQAFEQNAILCAGADAVPHLVLCL